MKDPLELSVSFSLSGRHLVATYAVINRQRRDAYLLNRLYRFTPEIEINPDIVYVHLDQGNRLVWLNKKVPDLPSGAMVTSPVAPFVTPLRSGSEFKEEFRITVPVREYREYSNALQDEQEPREEVYNGAYFSLGYYWRQDGTTEEEREIDGTTVILTRAPTPYQPPEAGLLESPVTELDIPVLAPKS